MEVERENVGGLLKKVLNKAHPEVLEDLVSGLTVDDVKSTADATTLFLLFVSIFKNAQAPATLVNTCLRYVWQLAMAPKQRDFVLPQRSGGASAVDGHNLVALSIIHAEAEWSQTAKWTQETSFANLFIGDCMGMMTRMEHLPLALSTLTILLESLSNPVRAEYRTPPEPHTPCGFCCIAATAAP